MSESASERRLGASPSESWNAGTTASDGKRESVSMSSGVLTVLSMYSRKMARPMPPTMPTRNASVTLRIFAGRAGDDGIIAGSTTRMLEDCSAEEMPASLSLVSKPS